MDDEEEGFDFGADKSSEVKGETEVTEKTEEKPKEQPALSLKGFKRDVDEDDEGGFDFGAVSSSEVKEEIEVKAETEAVENTEEKPKEQPSLSLKGFKRDIDEDDEGGFDFGAVTTKEVKDGDGKPSTEVI